MLNKVMLIGNLGADPEIRYQPSGDSIASLRLATTRKWKDKNGEKKEETEWHRVTLFGALAKVAGEYTKKGSKLYIEGRIKTDKWQKDGQDMYTTGIVGESLQMLDSRPEASQQRDAAPQSQASSDYSDDIPF